MDLALLGSIEPFYHETAFPISFVEFVGAGSHEGGSKLTEATFCKWRHCLCHEVNEEERGAFHITQAHKHPCPLLPRAMAFVPYGFVLV